MRRAITAEMIQARFYTSTPWLDLVICSNQCPNWSTDSGEVIRGLLRGSSSICGALSQKRLLDSIRPKVTVPAVLETEPTVTQNSQFLLQRWPKPLPVLIAPTHGSDGQAELSWAMAGYIPRWYARPKTVSHPVGRDGMRILFSPILFSTNF